MISLSIYTANNVQAFQVGQDTLYDNLLKRNHPRTHVKQKHVVKLLIYNQKRATDLSMAITN